MNAKRFVQSVGCLLIALTLLIGSWSSMPPQPVSAAGVTVVVDDGSKGFTASRGWARVTSGWTRSCKGVDGDARWTYSRIPGNTNVVDWVKWTPNLPKSGKYKVFVFVPGVNNGRQDTRSARYRIHHAKGDKTVTISQRGNWCGWVSLGTFQFNAGKKGYVYLGDYTGGESPQTSVVADAVKFVYDPEPVSQSFCVPTSGNVSQRYIKGKHEAIDIAAGSKKPVYAAHSGRVVYIGRAHGGNCPNYAYAMAIRYDGKVDGKYVLTFYDHLGRWVPGQGFESYIQVRLGQEVKKGQLIGYQGDAPRGIPQCSTATNGIHLHFSIHEMDHSFKSSYPTWGKQCNRSDLFYELGGQMACAPNPQPAKSANPEAGRYFGTLQNPVHQTCK